MSLAEAQAPDPQGNGPSIDPSVSADGRYIAFSSMATNLVGNDTNGLSDVFIRDRSAGTTQLVSVSSSGAQGDGRSIEPVMSPDGRYVAFESSATNLVGNDTNSKADIFLRDLAANTTTRVSVSYNGGNTSGGSSGCSNCSQSENASISSDARYIAFQSGATNVVSGDSNTKTDIFVRDMQSGTNSLVSVSSSGNQANQNSKYASISADGRFVAFHSHASNLVANDNNSSMTDIFLRDTSGGQTYRVSESSEEVQGNKSSESTTWVSQDGRYIAFNSSATNLVPNDTNASQDVFVRDNVATNTSRASVDSDENQGNAISDMPTISGDGRYVGFYSSATNLVAGDTNGAMDIFVRDQSSGTTDRVSVDSQENQSNGNSDLPAFALSGGFVVFQSDASNLVPNDTNGLTDVFVRDLSSGTTSRVSLIDGNRPPVVSLSVSPTQGTTGTTFSADTAGTFDPEGDGIAYLIDWGDGTSTSAPSGTHRYSSPGGYQIVATATDALGQSSSKTQQVLLDNLAPVVSFSVSPSEGEVTTEFSASLTGSSDPDGDPITHKIEWGDGAVTNAESGSHTYAAPGIYAVKGTVSDNRGAITSKTQNVRVGNRAPIARMSVTPQQGDTNTSFTADMIGSSDPDGDPLTYEIEWGDGTTTSGSRGTHRYSTAGDYTITGTATDSLGVATSSAVLVRVCDQIVNGQCVSSDAAAGQLDGAASVMEEAAAQVFSALPPISASARGYHKDVIDPGGYVGNRQYFKEPMNPFPIPTSINRAGCATNPTEKEDAVQVIYATNSHHGSNRYLDDVENLARMMDRVDWALDRSSDYDQHVRFSCKTEVGDSEPYLDYAKALIEEEIVPAEISQLPQEARSGAVRTFLQKEHDRSDRWYLVFTDFPSASDADIGCQDSGNCWAVVEAWATHNAGHELLHILGAGHAWRAQYGRNADACKDEDPKTSCATGDLDAADMMGASNWFNWQVDVGFNNFYDPQEPATMFYIDPLPSTVRRNIASHGALTQETSIDNDGFNDHLSALVRTMEGDARTQFDEMSSVTRAATGKYYDGRQALRIETQGLAKSEGIQLRNPIQGIQMGRRYSFYAALALSRTYSSRRSIELAVRWLDSAGNPISIVKTPAVVLGAKWSRRCVSGVAPSGATQARIIIQTPARQAPTAFLADALLVQDDSSVPSSLPGCYQQ